MTTPAIFAGTMGASGSVDIGDNIPNSLMLDSSLSQYLSRTLATDSTHNKQTQSFWLKRGKLGAYIPIYSSEYGPTDYTIFRFTSNDELELVQNDSSSLTVRKITSAKFRDPTASLHVVIQTDGTQAAGSRNNIYVNGVLQALSLNTDNDTVTLWGYNSAYPQRIGCSPLTPGYYNGYMSMYHFIDGQALTPSSFGRVSPDTGQWVPKDYTGSYGTNGFKLDFTNGAALGTDSSGNGNNWTVNGGITSANQYTDTLTNNYCVLNPLAANGGGVFSRGNTRYTVATTANQMASSTIIVSAGKWYVEASFDTAGTGNFAYLGLVPTSASFASGQYPGSAVGSYGAQCTSASVGSYTGGVVTNATPGAYNNSTPLKMAVDFDAGKVWFGISTWLGGGNPAAGTLPTYTFTPGTALAVCIGAYQQSSVLNTGARPFAYTPPIGFKALCTANLISEVVTVSGTFTGNAAADGPFVFCNGYPTTLTINSNAVTFGTHADKTANGFKLRTSSAGYNAAGSNSWTATIVSNRKNALKYANAQGNP